MNEPKLVVQARWDGAPVYVFLEKDKCDRKHNGSVYYWSTHMSSLKFMTEAEAIRKVNRLKIKSQVTDIKVVEWIPGVQLVYHDGRTIPSAK